MTRDIYCDGEDIKMKNINKDLFIHLEKSTYHIEGFTLEIVRSSGGLCF